MSLESLKRFDRIVAILIQLQSKHVVKAQELADRFEVSLRTIYRDIRTLEASGVPIYSEAGVGYSIIDGYRLPPVMFTRKEAGSFVAAEKLMQKFTDKSLGDHYESAMYKLKSVLRGTEKDMVEAIESQVFVNHSEELFNKNVPDALEILFESIAEKRQVFLLYASQDSDSLTERKIEAVGIFHENRHWYVTGFCHLRKDYRLFRTDRIQKITRTEISFQREHPSLDHFLKNHKSTHTIKIRISVAKEVVKYIKSERNYYGFVSEKVRGNQVEMTFMSRDLEDGFPRWYLMFGDYAKVIEPESLKQKIREILKNTEKGIE